MKHISLASYYRPQLFSEIAGQDTIRTVLSRASLEDRVAPGYLFCGTRGVGKTTAARIFAKALNCQNAPANEPCNKCEHCTKITAGIHPDVIEIDGASNNSVADVRSIQETIGYAPMEGRYKVFIIDEAHMLSKAAFNAFLKTLEEPPHHVTFIFATTEVHKFPATILSRCQVFSFRHLSEEQITHHLEQILHKEDILASGIEYEPSALRLISRRAAGSVRDSMSLLDQVLSFGEKRLTTKIVREVLGLVGIEDIAQLFHSLAKADCVHIALLCRELASKEVDIGFFVRDLVSQLRSLFLLQQCGADCLPQFGLQADEIAMLSEIAQLFSSGYLHAAWQMVLNEQKNIVTSKEPASSLELLLLNLALLPQLVSPQSASQQSIRAMEPLGKAPILSSSANKTSAPQREKTEPSSPASPVATLPSEAKPESPSAILATPQPEKKSPLSQQEKEATDIIQTQETKEVLPPLDEAKSIDRSSSYEEKSSDFTPSYEQQDTWIDDPDALPAEGFDFTPPKRELTDFEKKVWKEQVKTLCAQLPNTVNIEGPLQHAMEHTMQYGSLHLFFDSEGYKNQIEKFRTQIEEKLSLLCRRSITLVIHVFNPEEYLQDFYSVFSKDKVRIISSEEKLFLESENKNSY